MSSEIDIAVRLMMTDMTTIGPLFLLYFDKFAKFSYKNNLVKIKINEWKSFKES